MVIPSSRFVQSSICLVVTDSTTESSASETRDTNAESQLISQGTTQAEPQATGLRDSGKQKFSKRQKQAWKSAWHSYTHGWWVELSAIVLALLCFTAAAILLGTIHDRPLASWTQRFPIAPNSLLSIFVTLTKTALLLVVSSCISQWKWLLFRHPRRMDDLQTFDSASRGPLGSIGFLFSVKGLLKNSLPALGAFVTICALGVDPLSQQVLSFPLGRTATESATVHLPSTNVYDDGFSV